MMLQKWNIYCEVQVFKLLPFSLFHFLATFFAFYLITFPFFIFYSRFFFFTHRVAAPLDFNGMNFILVRRKWKGAIKKLKNAQCRLYVLCSTVKQCDFFQGRGWQSKAPSISARSAPNYWSLLALLHTQPFFGELWPQFPPLVWCGRIHKLNIVV